MNSRTRALVGVALIGSGLAIGGGSVRSQLRMDNNIQMRYDRQAAPRESLQSALNGIGTVGGAVLAASGVFLSAGGLGSLLRRDQSH